MITIRWDIFFERIIHEIKKTNIKKKISKKNCLHELSKSKMKK